MLYIQWKAKIASDELAFVHPDGCRDLIVLSRPSQPDKVFLTEWDLCRRKVAMNAGTQITGFRLRPSLTFDPRCIAEGPNTLSALGRMIESEAFADDDIIAPTISI